MSYPAFGKVKTIVLPISSEIGAERRMSIEEYKRLTGIDLKDYLYFDGSNICFDAKGACVYIQVLDNLGDTHLQYGLARPCVPVTNTKQNNDSTGKNLIIGTLNVDEDGIAGIAFNISNSAEQIVDNITIGSSGF